MSGTAGACDRRTRPRIDSCYRCFAPVPPADSPRQNAGHARWPAMPYALDSRRLLRGESRAYVARPYTGLQGGSRCAAKKYRCERCRRDTSSPQRTRSYRAWMSLHRINHLACGSSRMHQLNIEDRHIQASVRHLSLGQSKKRGRVLRFARRGQHAARVERVQRDMRHERQPASGAFREQSPGSRQSGRC
jgi:hypothetical protein